MSALCGYYPSRPANGHPKFILLSLRYELRNIHGFNSAHVHWSALEETAVVNGDFEMLLTSKTYVVSESVSSDTHTSYLHEFLSLAASRVWHFS